MCTSQNKDSSLHPRFIPVDHVSNHANLENCPLEKKISKYCNDVRRRQKDKIKGIYIFCNWNLLYQSLTLGKFQITPNFSDLYFFLLHSLSSISLPVCICSVLLSAFPVLQLCLVLTYALSPVH